MPAWETAGSAASPRASSIRWRRCSSRRWATGSATSTASSGRPSRMAGSSEQPDNWLRRPDPWEVARPQETGGDQARLLVRGARRKLWRAVAGRPSSLLGMPFDRPVVGYGGKTINTLRLWAAATPDSSTSRRSAPANSSARWPSGSTAESLTRVLYPDDSTSMGQGLRFVQEYFLVACSLADLVRRFRRDNTDWSTLPDKVAIQLNDTHPSLAVAELMRILLDEAGSAGTRPGISPRTLAYTNHTLLPEALEKWPLRWFELLLPRHSRSSLRSTAASRRGARPLPGRRRPRRRA